MENEVKESRWRKTSVAEIITVIVVLGGWIWFASAKARQIDINTGTLKIVTDEQGLFREKCVSYDDNIKKTAEMEKAIKELQNTMAIVPGIKEDTKEIRVMMYNHIQSERNK